MPTSKHPKAVPKKKKCQEASWRAEGLKATRESMAAAQKTGQKIFMNLVEETVTPEKLVELARNINPDLYEQVEVDRGASGVCGYPLCSNEFSDSYGDQMYKIRNNKVYDVTLRRNFCSDICYEASKLLKQQVSIEPLYLRENIHPEALTVKIPLREQLKGLPGEEVDIAGGIKLPYMNQKAAPREFTSFADVAQDGLKMCAENTEEDSGGWKKNQKETSKGNLKTASGGQQVKEKGSLSGEADNKNFQQWRQHMDTSNTSNGPSREASDPVAAVLEIERSLRDWMTFESLCFILGDPYVKGMLEHLGASWEDFDSTEGMKLSVEAKAKYIALCRKLDEEERADGDGPDLTSREVMDLPKKPLPNYQQLQQDAKKQQLKVVSFYEGKDQYEADDQSSKDDEAYCKPSLPLIDSYSQVEWRQSIVLEKLEKYINPFIPIAKLEESKVKDLIKQLVLTFNFNPNNIIFKPGQWNFVCFLLLKMLGIRIPAIQEGMSLEEFVKFQETLLSSFNLDSEYPDRFLQYIAEIKYIIRKQNAKDDSIQDDLTQNLQKIVVRDGVKNAMETDDKVTDHTRTSSHSQNNQTLLDDLD